MKAWGCLNLGVPVGRSEERKGLQGFHNSGVPLELPERKVDIILGSIHSRLETLSLETTS